ncbi:MAG: glycosyltransferase family 4 protein [Pseudomonadota bacterium]
MTWQDPQKIDVIAPNFKRRLSGVTATIVRLVPLQSDDIAIAASGPCLPEHVPQIKLGQLLSMSRHGPSGARVWHARRNTEMLAGLVLRYAFGKDLRLLFTSASQRQHTGYSRWLIARMDRVIATSAKGARYLERPPDIVLHGIDAQTFSPHGPIADESVLGPGPRIGCFGRIRAQKGTDVFVDAMMHVLRDRPGTALVMGRATDKHKSFLDGLKAKVAAAGMTDRIRFLPEVEVHEIAQWYRALDLFVAPQRWEGFGLTPLEAMASGVPTIATRVGAFEDLIIDGAVGALIDPGDTAAMASIAAHYLDDPILRANQAEAARAHILENFQIEGEASRLVEIYRDMLAS